MPICFKFNRMWKHLGLAIVLLLRSHSSVIATDLPANVTRIESLSHDDVEFFRDDLSLYVRLSSPDSERSVEIPRVFASLRSCAWLTDTPEKINVQVVPQPNSWTLNWDKVAPESTIIQLSFESRPMLRQEVTDIYPAADGSFRLPAYLATTVGNTLRFEPQPAKNTVGYWVNADDYATWQLNFPQAGTYNVGILQGCGKGQGGSTAQVSLGQNNVRLGQVKFSVLETGHFQNFVWRNVGTISVPGPGQYDVRLEVVQLNKNAVMDVRELQLTPVR